jgi:hypothetical protein
MEDIKLSIAYNPEENKLTVVVTIHKETVGSNTLIGKIFTEIYENYPDLLEKINELHKKVIILYNDYQPWARYNIKDIEIKAEDLIEEDKNYLIANGWEIFDHP